MVTLCIYSNKNVGRADFSDQFRKIIICYSYKRIGYKTNIMRQWLTQSGLINLLPSLTARQGSPGVGRNTCYRIWNKTFGKLLKHLLAEFNFSINGQ